MLLVGAYGHPECLKAKEYEKRFAEQKKEGTAKAAGGVSRKGESTQSATPTTTGRRERNVSAPAAVNEEPKQKGAPIAADKQQQQDEENITLLDVVVLLREMEARLARMKSAIRGRD